MSIRVKQLVKDYEDWHVSHIGAYSTDHIAEQQEYVASDDEEQDLGDWQEPLAMQEELDEESEPECLDDLATCREVSEKELELRGLINYDVVRNIATWPEEVLKDFAKYGDVHRLPKVSEDIRRLVGQPVLVYEMTIDAKERMTVHVAEQMDAWFSVGGVIVGEANNSNPERETVIVQTISGQGLPPAVAYSVSISDLLSSIELGVQEMKGFINGARVKKTVCILVANQTMLQKYTGRNLRQQTHQEWLGIQNATRAERNGGLKHDSNQLGQSEDSFAEALNKMNGAQGSDFFEEAQMAEIKRRDDEKKVLQEAKSSGITPLFRYDQRPKLSSQDIVVGRSRCAIYSCAGILEKFESECCVCECVKIDMCTCEGCGQPYNPNRHKKCGTQGCDTLFSHHPHVYKQTKKAERQR